MLTSRADGLALAAGIHRWRVSVEGGAPDRCRRPHLAGFAVPLQSLGVFAWALVGGWR